MIDLGWLISFMWANLIGTIIAVVVVFALAFIIGLVRAFWQAAKYFEGNHEDFDNDQ